MALEAVAPYHLGMQWIEFEGESPFMSFQAVQGDAKLSVDLATVKDIDDAVAELKHQIDVAAARMKMVLQKPFKLNLDAQGS